MDTQRRIMNRPRKVRLRMLDKTPLIGAHGPLENFYIMVRNKDITLANQQVLSLNISSEPTLILGTNSDHDDRKASVEIPVFHVNKQQIATGFLFCGHPDIHCIYAVTWKYTCNKISEHDPEIL